METDSQKIVVCPVCKADSELRYTKGTYLVRRCIACGLLFIENPPARTDSVYDEGYFVGGNEHGGYMDYDAEKEAMKETWQKALALLNARRGKLLDVGAATGYFVAMAAEDGWDAEGIDISPAAAALAEAKGRRVRAGTFETVSYPADSFDAATAFDVVEHVSQPGGLVESVAELLRSGGLFLISTPDTGSLYARLMGRRWHLLCPPEHLTLFNASNLHMLLEVKGFEVLWVGKIPKRFTPQYIFQTAGRWLHLPFLKRLGTGIERTPLRHLSIPLDLRDNMFVLARKI